MNKEKEAMLQALKAEGYTIKPFVLEVEDELFPQGTEVFVLPTYTATLGDETPSEKNIYHKVYKRLNKNK